ncbi:hypothetical protein H8959_000202 [Pygathrix nigripes]
MKHLQLGQESMERKVVFWQQIYAMAVSEAVRQLWHEGPQYFYQGIYPPLLSKTLQGTLLFGT